MKICLLSSSANVTQVPESVSVLISLLIIALIVVCVVLHKKKQEKQAEEAAKAKELARIQFNQDLERYIEDFTCHGLPQVKVDQLQLTNGEICHFSSEATQCKIKNRVVGYEGGYRGHSIRIAKGLSFRLGSTAKQAVRADVEFTTQGHLYVTNKKIVFIAPANSKSISINSIVSLNKHNQYVVILNNQKEEMFAVPNQALLLGILHVLLKQR